VRSTPTVAGAVIAHAGRVLLIRRTAPACFLLWAFPSGKPDPGESAAEAAPREARKEAGVLVAPLVVLGSRVHLAGGLRGLSAAGRCGACCVAAGGGGGAADGVGRVRAGRRVFAGAELLTFPLDGQVPTRWRPCANCVPKQQN
jgi:8-oxo-dGTP pyrophosphatase MutT (NUDIX family)